MVAVELERRGEILLQAVLVDDGKVRRERRQLAADAGCEREDLHASEAWTGAPGDRMHAHAQVLSSCSWRAAFDGARIKS